MPFVDVAVLPAQFEKPLHGADVAKIGGANKFVSRHAEFVPEASPGSSHLGNEFGFGDAGFFRRAFDVNAVFVGAGGHHDFIAAHTLVTANDVGDDGRVGMTDVGQAVRVVDGRRQIEFWLLAWHFLLFLLSKAIRSWS